MCGKWWLQKFDLTILKTVTCLGFFIIEEFYQGWNFGCFLWNFSNINPICCTYQNFCMTFTNIFGFLLNFSHSWISFVKENWPRKSLFHNFWLKMSWFMTQGQNEGGIYLSPWNHERWLSPLRTHKSEYVFSFWWTNQELGQ